MSIDYKKHMWSRSHGGEWTMVKTYTVLVDDLGNQSDIKENDIRNPITEREWEEATDILDRAYGVGLWRITQ